MCRLLSLLFVVVAQFPTIFGVSTVYVRATTPSTSSSNCPNETSCPTLSEMITRASRAGEQQLNVFSSNQNVIFFSGVHVINVSNQFLYTGYVDHLTLQGIGNSTIVCVTKMSFLFADISSVIIKSLRFINCESFAQYLTEIVRENSNYTFVFWQFSEVVFNSVEIVGNNHTGIVVVSGDRFKVLKSKFSTGGIGIFSQFTSGRIIGTYFSSSSLKISGSLRLENSIEIIGSVFEEITTWPVVSCVYLKLLSLENVKIINNPSRFLMYISECTVSVNIRSLFSNNSGAVVLTVEGMLNIDRAEVNFVNNRVDSSSGLPGAPLCVVGGRLVFDNSHVTFLNNSGEDSGGILVLGTASFVEFINSVINFTANKGADGGAMAMYKQATLLFKYRNEKTSIFFVENKASKQGGGLFIDDDGYMNQFHRNYSHSFIGPSSNVNAQLVFISNTAKFSGNQIHGGWIDWWISHDNFYLNNNSRNLFHFEPNGPLDVSSSPTRVCMCKHSIINCNLTEYSVTIFPGQAVTLEVVTVGQRYGTTISFITASTDEAKDGVFNSDHEVIPKSEYFQTVQRACTPVHYTIMSPRKEERILLLPFQSNKLTIKPELLRQYLYQATLFDTFSIKVTLTTCPLGFVFSNLMNKCVCLKSLKKHGLSCSTLTFQVVRTEHKWISAVFNHTKQGEYPGVIVHDQCPYDYCRNDVDSLSFNLELQDKQCANNRSGVLCGMCQTNLSQILGSSRCKRCSNLMLLAIIPIVIVSGLSLIAFLMIFNLTVSAGTINGLVFYANVIRAQHSMFFTPEISNSFLSKFIAWLNLDLGIETCLYDGLDAYAKIWLQFLFPCYIWLLVIAIVISSHYSSRVSRLSGNNAVQVLATLLLLSYTKILRITITVFSSTLIVYPDNQFSRWVWLYDGNVEFLKGKHLVLFIFTLLMFVLLSVPYTLSLLTIQWLLRVSHFRIFFWVQKLKPLFDAYTGPYKIRHRYWTGLLLIVRVMVLMAFSLNQANNSAVNLFIISIISFALLLFLYFTKWVYKSIINNCLEITCILNLGILSTSVLFEIANNKRSATVVQLSTGFTLLLFALVIVFHIQQKLLHSRIGKKLQAYAVNKYSSKRRQNELAPDVVATSSHHDINIGTTSTVVELK